MRPAISIALLTALFVGGCVGTQMTESQLYFGQSVKDQPNVSDEQWRQFLDEVVTPRYPDGFTITTAEGQWRGPDGKIVREPSRVLSIVRSNGPENNRKIEEIREAYKQRFHQDAVLRVDEYANVRF